MELVYLWVEDYKNIHKQGFNFSPRFSCNYNEEKNELTIDINDEYMENFFGKNINITAIVGKNGSGKSNLLDGLLDYIYNNLQNENFYRIINCLILKFDKKIYVLYDKYDLKLNIFKTNEEYIFIKIWKSYDNPLRIRTNGSFFIDEKFKKEGEIETKKLQNFLKLLKKEVHLLYYEYSINPRYKLKGENSFLPDNDSHVSIYNSKEDIKAIIKYILNKKENKHNIYYGNYFEPDTVEIVGFDINTNYIRKYYLKEMTIYEKFKLNIYMYLYNLIVDTIEINTLKNNSSKLKDDFIESLNKIDTFKGLEEYILSYTFEKELERIKDIDELNKIKEYVKFLDKNKEYIEKNFFNKKELDHNEMIHQFKSKFDINMDYINIKKYIRVLLELPSFFNIKIYEKNTLTDKKSKFYNDLSSGEKSILRIRFWIENLISKEGKNNFLILLDEPENDMHPNWQKKLLNYLIEIFKDREERLHFIFTTHSPFILSDLYKQNIIFLDTYKKDEKKNQKEGNCKVVEGLSQTFGANIHTLLSDSFFMEDGLMGEFAKGKINEIKEFYEKVKLEKKTDDNVEFYNKHKERFWQIQKIIGEPFLQKVIKNYLDELELLFSDDNTLIEKELADIEKRKAYLESLKNA